MIPQPRIGQNETIAQTVPFHLAQAERSQLDPALFDEFVFDEPLWSKVSEGELNRAPDLQGAPSTYLKFVLIQTPKQSLLSPGQRRFKADQAVEAHQ